MEPNLRAFGEWMGERLKRCEQPALGLARKMGYDRSVVSRVLAGQRRPSEQFLAQSLLVLWEWGAFEHPAEIVDGVALLGIDIEGLRGLIKKEVEPGRETEASKFLAYLEGWNKPFASPEAQGVRLPLTHVGRAQLMADLRQLLTTPALEGTGRRVVLWGMGGAGKTMLARAAALDPQVLRVYRNGVLWADVSGGEPERCLREWCHYLGISLQGDETVWELSQMVREEVGRPWARFLIVLDNVWRVEDVEPLLVDGPQGGVLLTMRERHLAQKLAADDRIVEVGMMEEDEARDLVRRRLGAQWQEEDEERAEELIRLVDRLPLALELGAAVVKRRGWESLLGRLRDGERAISALALSRPERREHSLRITLDISYERLPTDEQELFERLSLLAPGESFTIWDVLFAWPSRTLLEESKEQKRVVHEHLFDLVDASLLMEEQPLFRYRFHPLVAAYAQEKLSQRADASCLRRDIIQHGLDILALGVGKWPGDMGLPPSGQSWFLDDHWPQVERAWQEARKWWREPVGDEDEEEIAEQALAWAYGFGPLGCQALARRRDWEGVSRWAWQALVLCREVYRTGWKEEPDGEEWGILLTWYLDGLLRQGKAEAAAEVLRHLQRMDFDAPAWDIRRRIREVRLKMLSPAKAKPRALQRMAEGIAFDADAWLAGADSELACHTLAETCLLLGDLAAECGDAAKAEQRWWEGGKWIVRLLPWGDDYGFDEWTLEEVTERVVRQRAEHRMWWEAAHAGRAWVALRRHLGADVVQLLVSVGVWSFWAGDEETTEWALKELEGEDPRWAEGARSVLRGLLLARRKQTADALSSLRAAQEWYAADPAGAPMIRFLEQAIAAVEEGTPLPPLAAKGAPYDIPCDWLTFSLGSFEDWLVDWLHSVTVK